MTNKRQQGHGVINEKAQADLEVCAEASMITDEVWQAILNNDSSFDGKFYYAVQTTGIFCRPSCKSRAPIKQHVRIFSDTRQALSENFRPCKRCRPDGRRLPDEEWVAQIVHLIETRYPESLTLAMLAERIHASPYHLHRTFRRIIGVTPAEYIQRTRISKAKQYLAETDKTIKDIALAVGIRNAAHFAILFQKKTGFTPTEYRYSFGTKKIVHQGGV